MHSRKRYLAYLLAIGLIVYIVSGIDLGALYAAFSTISLRSIGYLAAISALLLSVSVMKWRTFLWGVGGDASFFFLMRLYLIGYFINFLLPSHVGGDAMRSYSLGKVVGQDHAATATVLERFTGLFAMTCLAFSFMWIGDLAPKETRLVVAILFSAVLMLAVVIFSERSSRFIHSIPFAKKQLSFVDRVHAGFLRVKERKRYIIVGLLFSFLFHALTILNTAVAGIAVGWEAPPLKDLFIVVPLILLVGGLPITPSGLGVQEGAFVYFLLKVGATKEQALALALVLRAKTYCLALLGSIVWFTRKREVA